MGIPRHSFPAASKLTSELVRNEAKPALRSSSHLGIGPKSRRVSPNQKGISPQRPRSPGITWTSTFGESLPGLLIETVVDPNCPTQLALLTYKSKVAEIRSCINQGGVEYRPGSIGSGLAQAVRFCRGSTSFGSDEDLASGVEEFLAMHIDQDARTLKLLTAFVFASWFTDCLQVGPVLWVHGPEHEVGVVMRLLNCLCYRPILLSDLDLTALRTLPARLRVTLLVKQTDLAPRVERALFNSAYRTFHMGIGKQPMEIFGARALHSDSSIGQIGLSVFIHPARRTLASLTNSEEYSIASQFQSKLMAYRFSHHQQVQEFALKPEASFPGLEDEMKTWLSAIEAYSDLDQSVRHAFAERRAESSAVRYEDPKLLVIEGALMFCHRKDATHFFVRELAEKVNDLLLGRHADFKLEDRKVGSVLNDLGIGKRRVTKGFRVDLTSEMRTRIHRIALAYHVLSAQAGVTHCAECKNNDQKRS